MYHYTILYGKNATFCFSSNNAEKNESIKKSKSQNVELSAVEHGKLTFQEFRSMEN